MTDDYRQGAFKALLFLRNWMDIHLESLHTFYNVAPNENGDAVEWKVKPFVRPKDNKKIQMLITAFIEDIDTFLKYGDDTEVMRWVDDKNNTIKIKVERNE